jgi:hypothetical protein
MTYNFVVHANVEDILKFPDGVETNGVNILPSDIAELALKETRINLILTCAPEEYAAKREKIVNALGGEQFIKFG